MFAEGVELVVLAKLKAWVSLKGAGMQRVGVEVIGGVGNWY